MLHARTLADTCGRAAHTGEFPTSCLYNFATTPTKAFAAGESNFQRIWEGLTYTKIC
jgi:hypothetical protein